MTTSFASNLDALGTWRESLTQQLNNLVRYLSEHELLDEASSALVESLRERLSHEKLIVAFVAEFSRGKSELINAIFFSDTGRRVLPATPGRTTMCPVELAWDPAEPSALSLLPIETRLQGRSLGEMRDQPQAWTRVPFDAGDADQLAEALKEVIRTRLVSREDARALGFWSDERPDDNPRPDELGRVEVPAWRHALINYPHPLLRQGLVVLDTPGLNAIGAEPELTLGLLPTAHATVFILGADTGVTKSDMAIWRDHLGTRAQTRFVVLNKIDALLDPLGTPQQTHRQIESQQHQTARTLEIPPERVFPLSARQALAARVGGDKRGLSRSRLPQFEEALGVELLPRRRELLERLVLDGSQSIENFFVRHLNDRRRQLAEQMLELRGLRGKSGAKLRLMVARIDADIVEFEQCTTRLQALRAVHLRMLKEALGVIASNRLREEVAEMQSEMTRSMLSLGAKRAFVALCTRLRDMLRKSKEHSDELREMLAGSFSQLNAEYGFSLSLSSGPKFERFVEELDLIETNYVQYLGLSQALRLAQPQFMEQFRRMLISKLRMVFENASAELDLWNKTASAQIDAQLRERRRAFRIRREALDRIQNASGELESRLAEIDAQDARLQQQMTEAIALVESLRARACDTRVAPTVTTSEHGLRQTTDSGFMDSSPAQQIGA